MTMQIVIQVAGQPDVVIGVSEKAMRRARVSFNPSSLPHVDNIKALAAGLYTVLRELNAEREDGWLAEILDRETSAAATQIQFGAMMAVSAATAHLLK